MNHPSLVQEKLVDVLRLIRSPNVGPITFFSLLRRFGSAQSALEALPDLARRGGRKTPLKAFGQAQAQQEIESCEQFGARMVMYGEADYPSLLHPVADPPPVISLLGKPIWKERQTIAIVGARNASASGCQLARLLAQQLAQKNYVIISGLARGIDTFAHKGAIERTVGVIAGGIDNIYPPENQMLYEQMKTHGAIISEQPFGTIPFPGAFPGRNRIIAGMSLGTLVIEASPKSGSLITARLAGEYGREVFAVPGSPLDPRSKGCNQLLKDGAVLVEDVQDIVRSLTNLQTAHQHMAEDSKAAYENSQSPAYGEAELARLRGQLIEKLGPTPVCLDELVEQCQTSAPALLAALLELELAGKAKRSSGNKVSLNVDVNQEVA